MPGYLLDTNVLSETRRKRADPGVIQFLVGADPDSLFLSVINLGELHRGVVMQRREDPSAARLLATWVRGIELNFADRVLSVSPEIAIIWGTLSAAGNPPVADTLIAATALHHGLTLVTRNIKSVAKTSVAILNPWSQLHRD
ncbi:MAG TPA: type II toxin-antitoxin system VapC family toxin [Terriglobales bacterium]|nr:type II toxin-antitoxin system VapC family toxin [Terriglobales bacterium]